MRDRREQIQRATGSDGDRCQQAVRRSQVDPVVVLVARRYKGEWPIDRIDRHGAGLLARVIPLTAIRPLPDGRRRRGGWFGCGRGGWLPSPGEPRVRGGGRTPPFGAAP